MGFKAVLFDFDGVIAPTMDYHVQAWIEAFLKYRLRITADDIYYQEGQPAAAIVRILSRNYGLNLTEAELDQIAANKHEIYSQLTQAKIYPEIITLIDQLKARSILIGIVTGSILPNMIPVTGEEFLRQFDVIVTSDLVQKNKPYPDPYLLAAEKLGLAPAACLVIENAPLGIQAAKTAGMFCVAIKTTIKDEKYLQPADLIIEDVTHLPLEKYFGAAKQQHGNYKR